MKIEVRITDEDGELGDLVIILPISKELYMDTPMFVSYVERSLPSFVKASYLHAQGKELVDGRFVKTADKVEGGDSA